jgi:hypothetical protein
MATLKDLFRSKQSEIYGKSENIRITSLGLINPPRAAALLASSPNSVADLIGNQIGGALGGSANRPSDTIFRNNTVFSKPISLFRTEQGLKNVIEADTVYYVKPNPAPASIFARIKQGGSSPLGVATNLARNAITKGGLKALSKNLKNYSTDETFGPKFGPKDTTGKSTVLIEDKKFSKYYKGEDGKLVKREGKSLRTWDSGSIDIQKTESFADDGKYTQALTEHMHVNQVWVTFRKYGTSKIIPFTGVISGISEDISAEISDFKYVGSPFKIYRYGGVERSLKFDLKLYYTRIEEKAPMIKKLNFLKSLAFPFDEVSMVQYANSTEFTDNTPTMFSPNLVYLNIDGLYKDTLGIVDSIGISIDDNTTWANGNPYMKDDGDSSLYPSVINVSFSMRMIENHKIHKEGNTKTYRYNFDGYTDKSAEKYTNRYIETPSTNPTSTQPNQ